MFLAFSLTFSIMKFNHRHQTTANRARNGRVTRYRVRGTRSVQGQLQLHSEFQKKQKTEQRPFISDSDETHIRTTNYERE